ncbi:MAG: hypothetical protein HOV68_09735 [Streptomycetaceae bacterium]|nr:hypothetical protein [Streptomycetaceae bacterium]
MTVRYLPALTIEGYTGDLETDAKLLGHHATMVDILMLIMKTDTEADRATLANFPEAVRHVTLHLIAAAHNRARPAVAAEIHAWADLLRQRARADHAYAYLAETSTARWAAAHHRYVEAADDLHTATTTWAKACVEAKAATDALRAEPLRSRYRSLVDLDQRLPLDFEDPDRVAAEISATHTRRLRIAAITLQALGAHASASTRPSATAG